MTSRQLLAVLAGTLTLFVLGFLLYGVLLAGFFEANMGTATGVMRDPPLIWALLLGNVVYAYLLLVVFGRWGGMSSFGAGARVAGVLGFLIALSFDLVLYSTTNVATLTATIVDPLVFLVVSGAAGGAIAWMLSRGAPAPA